jgi:transposase-like protein
MSEPDPSVTTSGQMTGAECPYCGSTDTEREHPRGPSRCQSIHYCNECHQQFKKFE